MVASIRARRIFPTRSVYSETTELKFKDGKKRAVLRQKKAGTVDKFASETGIPRFGGRDDGVRFSLYANGPVLGDKFASKALSSEYLAKYPTPDKYTIDAPTRGNAPPLGIIGHLAVETDLRAMRRLAEIGRQTYAEELVEKDRAKTKGKISHIGLHSVGGLGFDQIDPPRAPANVATAGLAQEPTQQKQFASNARRRMATARTATGDHRNGRKTHRILQPRSPLHRAHGSHVSGDGARHRTARQPLD